MVQKQDNRHVNSTKQYLQDITLRNKHFREISYAMADPIPKVGLFCKLFAENCMKEFGPQEARPWRPLDLQMSIPAADLGFSTQRAANDKGGHANLFFGNFSQKLDT